MKKVFVDLWEGNIDKGESFFIDSFIKVQKLLKRLDGKITTQILLVEENDDYKEHSLLIGGGNNGLYVVTYTLGEEEAYYNLCNPVFIDNVEEIELTTRGQVGTFAKKYCMSLETITEATKYYIDTGGMNPKLIWKED